MNVLSTYDLWKTGQLDFVIERGIVRHSVVEYCKIYDVYIQLRQGGYNYTNAVEITAERLCLTDSKVKFAIAQVI